MWKLLIICILGLPFSIASLHSQFRHFEEIIPLNINIRHKRDIRNPQIYTKLVNFDALGKSFQLQLFPDNSIFSDDFEVQFIDSVGQATTTAINTDGLYSGHEKNDPRNKVNAVHHEGEWYLYVQTPEDVFVIEPISRLDPQRKGNSLIAYRSRDVLTNISKDSNDQVPFCRASKVFHVEEKGPSHTRGYKNHGHKSNKRQRRMFADVADTCDVFVVVDYLTYIGVGRKSPDAIVKWISYLFKCVDNVLRKSGLNVNGVTYGVMIKGIRIHKEFTKVKAGKMHYNMKGNHMDDEATIISFMETKWHENYCLAHLITQRKFGGVLGVATIADETWSNPNGICMNNKAKSDESRNAGFTTTIDEYGNILPLEKHVLTTSHEIGHNFGAEHDPSYGPCAPSSADGGKYIMWPYSGSQRGPNSRIFSPGCSIPKLQKVMKAKAYKCFLSKNSLRRFCGDGLVSLEEDCDLGLLHDTTKDKCCTSRCRFRNGAVCSPNHHPCCTKNCQVAPKTQACVRVTNNCVKDSTCDGVNAFTCPRPSPMDNGSPCGEDGTCWQGLCMTFCENLGRVSSPPRQLQSCNCDQNTTMMCKLCCVDLGKDHRCVQMGGVQSDGRNCLQGVCQKGVCMKMNIGRDGLVVADVKDKDDEAVSSGATILAIFVNSYFAILSYFLFSLIPILLDRQ